MNAAPLTLQREPLLSSRGAHKGPETQILSLPPRRNEGSHRTFLLINSANNSEASTTDHREEEHFLQSKLIESYLQYCLPGCKEEREVSLQGGKLSPRSERSCKKALAPPHFTWVRVKENLRS